MKDKLLILIKHPLISGSGIVFIGTLFANICNFLFNLFMSRLLTVEEYGTLASILSFITLPTLAAGAITPVVVNFAAIYFAKNELSKAKGLFVYFNRGMLVVAVILLAILFLTQNYISGFFHISDDRFIFIADLIIVVSIFSIINVSFLQAKLAFGYVTLTNFLGALTKATIGITLVYVGFSVLGAEIAFFVSFLVPYILNFLPLRAMMKKSAATLHVTLNELMHYGIPSALVMLGLTSLITTDIMLAKHFFSEQQAGIYAGLSLIGRVIFFFSAPIGSVMFPIIVQRHARSEEYKQILFMAIGLVFACSAALTIFYFMFPEFTIRFFIKREEYLVAAPYLGLFGIFITLYSVLSVLVSFFLSIKKTGIYIPVVITALLQIILIMFYHTNIMNLVYISMGTTFSLLIILLLYYPYATKKK